MRILFIRSNPVFPDSRVEKEIGALQEAGHNVELLAWDRNADYPLRMEFLNDSMHDICAYRVGIKANYGSGIKNIGNLLKFQYEIFKFLKTHVYDAIHACDFDTAFTAFHLINRDKTKFIYDIFDFYVDAYNVPNILKELIKCLDYKIIEKANCVIICTEERRQQIAGSNPKKVVVIHNTPPMLVIDKKNQTLHGGGPKICYVGILQPGRLLIELGEVVKNHPDWELHIGGFGMYEEYFKKLSEEYANIFYYGRLPYERTLNLESKCDIMLALYDPNVPNHKYAAPNKFYEALFLGKPIIMVKETGMSSVVKENDIGVLIDYSEDGFLDGLNRLISKKNEWGEISKKMKRLYNEKYSWTEMEKRLYDLYGDL